MFAVPGFLATVLICDDEPALRELIRVSLDGEYEFVEADDGIECLEILRRVRPDIVVLDVMMPRRSGLEVLRDIRADNSIADTKVIVLTAQPAAREDALRGGANLVIEKPFTPDDITNAVEEVLAGRA
jgi:CheY-like chemotaxis protein